MSDELFERGLKVRREVLGKDYVDASLKNATDFNMPMQRLSTEYCWGTVWGSDDLPRKTRSLVNLAMISALNRPHELRLHVRGAINNGVTVDEIRGVLMQVAIYCGIPAGMDAFRNAGEVLAQIEKEQADAK
ncbi:MAG TPA: carboxymuconolactone decarboxylase family protein [Eoetvoesiella sp.]